MIKWIITKTPVGAGELSRKKINYLLKHWTDIQFRLQIKNKQKWLMNNKKKRIS
ncbi:MAG: hypothetical protein ACOC5T_08600 [Elusimicrobiota bacterium]